MLILALDTATETGSLALVEGERLLVEYSLESGTYLSRLLPRLAQLVSPRPAATRQTWEPWGLA